MKMNAIIQRIAKQHGVTPTEVEKQMQFAIQEAMKSTDPVAQAHWKKISPDGNAPTIEDFLIYITKQLH